MKKKLFSLFLVALMMVASSAVNGQAPKFEYDTRVTLDEDDGMIYLRTDCLEFTGDNCTHPGSSHRTATGIAAELLGVLPW